MLQLPGMVGILSIVPCEPPCVNSIELLRPLCESKHKCPLEMHRADGIVCRLRSPNSKKVPEEWLNPGGTIGPRNYNPPDSHTLTHAPDSGTNQDCAIDNSSPAYVCPVSFCISASLHLCTHKQGIATGMRFTQQKKTEPSAMWAP